MSISAFIPQDQKLGDFCEQWMEKQALKEVQSSFVQGFECSLGFEELGAVLWNRTTVLSDVYRFSRPSANHRQAQLIIRFCRTSEAHTNHHST